MVAAYERAAHEAGELLESATGKAEADTRADEAYAALLALRPTEPAALVRVMCWRLEEIRMGGRALDDPEFFEWASAAAGAFFVASS
jgi:hypothetical protein